MIMHKKPSDRYRWRKQVLLDDATYEWLLNLPATRARGISAAIREILEAERDAYILGKQETEVTP